MKNNSIEINEITRFLNEIFIDEPIYQEADTELNKTIYMPLSIKKLIEVPVVNRMNRILQTGANIYDDIKMIGTRMQHSKGTYSLMLELLTNLWERDEGFKQRVIQNKQQKYIKAILVKEILHDLGHGPFSHTLEVVCSIPRGFHEIIGKRLRTENKQLNAALNNIEDGLPEIITELEENDTLGLNRLSEGQFDVDRADFLSRDSFFAAKDYRRFISIVQELIKNVRIKQIKNEAGKTYLIPIFEANQMSNIEQFLQIRLDNYDQIYISNSKYMYEQIFKSFGTRLLDETQEYPLKTFLQSIIGKSAEEIDLDKYVSLDDIEFLKETIKVVQSTENMQLKKLGLMVLPKINMVPGLYYGVMISSNTRVTVGEQLSESDEQFIRDMKTINSMRNEISNNKNFIKENCFLLDTDKESEVGAISSKVQRILINGRKDRHLNGVKVWVRNQKEYKNKPGEEIYIASDDGKYYEYSIHPNRTKAIENRTKAGMCVVVPELEMDGYSASEIQMVRNEINTFNNRDEVDVDK